MKDSIDNSEPFLIHKLKPGTPLLSFLEEAAKAMEESDKKYLILGFQPETEIGSEAFENIQNLNEYLSSQMGLLVCVHENHLLMPKFEEKGLLLVPTENEAIEYVFMDELEKQFLQNDEEE